MHRIFASPSGLRTALYRLPSWFLRATGRRQDRDALNARCCDVFTFRPRPSVCPSRRARYWPKEQESVL